MASVCLAAVSGPQLSGHTSASGPFTSPSAGMDERVISFKFRDKSFFIMTFLFRAVLGSQQVMRF